tara:strand:- start:10020 stop:10319 length:300 start_codon:yes stop_codon:yes gene_type:complete
MVAMLHRLADVMPPSPAVATKVAARRTAAARAAARAAAAKAVAKTAARAVATNVTTAVATTVDAMPHPPVVPSPPVAVALLVQLTQSRCPPRRSPMLPR